MNTFKGFEWNLDTNISAYQYVTIVLDTAYVSGIGWTNKEEQQFKDELYPKLEKAGYTIVKANKDIYSDTFKKDITNDKTDIYMHPRVFEGYIKDSEICGLIDLLTNCDCIKDAKVVKAVTHYDITDSQYRQLIIDRAKDILERYKPIDDKTFAMDFAKECRLPRIGDNKNISVDDIDYQTVSNIVDIAKSLNAITNQKDYAKNLLMSLSERLSKATNTVDVKDIEEELFYKPYNKEIKNFTVVNEYYHNELYDFCHSVEEKYNNLLNNSTLQHLTVESTDEHEETGFCKEIIDENTINSDGTIGTEKDYYRLVAINEEEIFAPIDDKVYSSREEARANIDRTRYAEVSYDDLSNEIFDLRLQHHNSLIDSGVINNKKKLRIERND